MIDNSKYDYHQLYVPNLLVEVAKGRSVDGIEVHVEIESLIDKLVRDYPNRTFIGQAQGGITRPAGFRVYESGELLGYIDISYRYSRTGSGSYQYCFSNDRIRKDMYRGNTVRTGDMKKALRIFATKFTVKSLSEMVRSAREMTREALATNAHRPRMVFNNLWRDLESNVIKYVMANWDDIMPKLNVNGEYNDIVAKYTEHCEARTVVDQYSAGHGVCVVQHGATYAIFQCNTSGEEFDMYTSDTLDPYIKGKLAMLKVVDTNTLVPDVGIRANDNMFFVVREPTDV